MKSTLAQIGRHGSLRGAVWSKQTPPHRRRPSLPWALLAALLVADGLVWQVIPSAGLALMWVALFVGTLAEHGALETWVRTLGFRDMVSRRSFEQSNIKVPR